MSDLREALHRRWAYYSLVAFSACVVLGKLVITWSHAHYNITSADGGYYYDLIDNLASDQGFVTNISPFHHALPRFPYPSIVYPLWPLVAAGFARLFGMTFAAYYLPCLLYFVSVWLSFIVGRRYCPRVLLDRGGLRLHSGHLLAFGLASNRGFYLATSRPYTEGLSYCLFLGASYLAYDYFRRPSLRNTLLLGLATAAVALTRSQMFLLYLAILSTSLLLFGVAPKKNWRFLPGVLGVSVVVVLCFLPYLSWLSQPDLHAGLQHYFQFASYSHQPGLLPRVEVTAHRPLLDWLGLRAKAAFEAFLPWEHYSYFEMFTCLSLALPLGIAWAAIGGVKRGRSPHKFDLANAFGRLRSWSQADSSGPALFVLCFALGSLLSLHLTHLDSPTHEWLFRSRHSLPALFSFVIALGLLLLMRGGARSSGRLLLLATVISGAIQLGDTTQRVSFQNQRWMTPGRKATIDWINEHSSPGNVPIIVTHLPYGKELCHFTPDAAYRALDYADTPEVAHVMFDKLPSDYLILWTQAGEFYGQSAEVFSKFATPDEVPGFKKIAKLPNSVIYERDKAPGNL